jgi:hypothetical protein
MTWSMIRVSDLDEATAERMLRGAVAPEDAPNSFAGAAALLQAARRPIRAADPAQEAQTLSAMVAAGSSSPATNRRTRMRTTTKLAAGTAVGVITLFGGLTAASAMSGTVSSGVTSSTGVSLPFAATNHPDVDPSPSTTSKDATADTKAAATTEADTNTNKPTDNHGACVSKVAQDKSTTGEAHGDAVSAAAKSDCGKASQGPTGPTGAATTSNSTTNHDSTGDTNSADAHADAHGGTPNSHASAGQATALSHRP